MKKGLFIILALAAGLSSAAGFPSLAGQWKQDYAGCWYDNGNGTYPAGIWQWIDSDNNGVAERYYFDENGYCVKNCVTPDGYQVDCDGAWTQDGLVQIRYIGINSYDDATKEALNVFLNEIFSTGVMPVESAEDVQITYADLGAEEKADILYWYQSLYGRSTDCRFQSVMKKEGTYNRVASEVLDDVLYEILGTVDNEEAVAFFADPNNGYVDGSQVNGMYTCSLQRERERPEVYLKADFCVAEKEVACLSGEVMIYQQETGAYEAVQNFRAYFTENHNSHISGLQFDRLVLNANHKYQNKREPGDQDGKNKE